VAGHGRQICALEGELGRLREVIAETQRIHLLFSDPSQRVRCYTWVEHPIYRVAAPLGTLQCLRALPSGPKTGSRVLTIQSGRYLSYSGPRTTDGTGCWRFRNAIEFHVQTSDFSAADTLITPITPKPIHGQLPLKYRSVVTFFRGFIEGTIRTESIRLPLSEPELPRERPPKIAFPWSHSYRSVPMAFYDCRCQA
jgi:hypothetical protein